VIAKQLQGNDVEQTLEAVDGLQHVGSLDILHDALVVFVAHITMGCALRVVIWAKADWTLG